MCLFDSADLKELFKICVYFTGLSKHFNIVFISVGLSKLF